MVREWREGTAQDLQICGNRRDASLDCSNKNQKQTNKHLSKSTSRSKINSNCHLKGSKKNSGRTYVPYHGLDPQYCAWGCPCHMASAANQITQQEQDIRWKFLWVNWPWFFPNAWFLHTHCLLISINSLQTANHFVCRAGCHTQVTKYLSWDVSGQKVQRRKINSIKRTVPQTFTQPTACSYQHAWRANKGPRPTKHLSTCFNFKHVPKCFAGHRPKEKNEHG